jgi:hypothetical protein
VNALREMGCIFNATSADGLNLVLEFGSLLAEPVIPRETSA